MTKFLLALMGLALFFGAFIAFLNSVDQQEQKKQAGHLLLEELWATKTDSFMMADGAGPLIQHGPAVRYQDAILKPKQCDLVVPQDVPTEFAELGNGDVAVRSWSDSLVLVYKQSKWRYELFSTDGRLIEMAMLRVGTVRLPGGFILNCTGDGLRGK